ncbi:MAG: sigma-E factor negative regulatory protein [Azoarcus sp.]|jgi:sigma-E factor negative regulatory protein RseA|nr:sigma-E factor negative regulatory protein [Azoarcus sp.]
MKEKLSAMLDGNVDEATVHALLTRLKHDAAFRDEWDAYCLLGDVIRDGAQPEMEGFTAAVMSRLEHEPTVLAPRRKETAAKQRSLRHRLLPVAASVMGVLAVGGVVAALSGGGTAVTPIAQVTQPSQPSTQQIVPVARRSAGGARSDYLLAHQAMAGGPMPAAVQYVRTVSASSEESDE